MSRHPVRAVCSFFVSGHCRYGGDCRFIHPLPHNPSGLNSDFLAESGPRFENSNNAAAQAAIDWCGRSERGASGNEPQFHHPYDRNAAGGIAGGHLPGSIGHADVWNGGGVGRGRGGGRPFYSSSRGWRGMGRGSWRGDSSRGRGGAGGSCRMDKREWLECNLEGPSVVANAAFTLVCYNILAVGAAAEHARELYPHVPPWILEWGSRKAAFLNEIAPLAPHILCLQEVDRYADLAEALEPIGFSGCLKARTGESSDGCALFWRRDRFSLVEDASFEFRPLGLRDNVAQLLVLRSLSSSLSGEVDVRADEGVTIEGRKRCRSSGSACLVVANIHVLFNPKRGDVKLGQVRVLVERARQVADRHRAAGVVLVGDFNSTPASAVYQFLSEGKLDVTLWDRRHVSGQLSGGEGIGNWVQRMGGVGYPRLSTSRIGHPLSNEMRVTTLIPAGASEEGSADSRIRLQTEREESCTAQTPQPVVEGSCEEAAPPGLEGGRQEGGASGHPEREKRGKGGGGWGGQRYLWEAEELENAVGGTGGRVMEHGLGLRSAYMQAQRPGGSSEPEMTSCHNRFCGVVDFVWYSPGLRPIRVLDTYPKHQVMRARGLLNETCPSDHMSLVCEMAFAGGGQRPHTQKDANVPRTFCPAE